MKTKTKLCWAALSASVIIGASGMAAVIGLNNRFLVAASNGSQQDIDLDAVGETVTVPLDAQWDHLGPYFKPAFAQFDLEETTEPPYYSSEERRADLIDRYNAFADSASEDAVQMCIPVHELILIASDDYLQDPAFALSPEQIVSQTVINYMFYYTSDGSTSEIMLKNAILNDVILCVDNDDPANSGHYNPETAIASYELRNTSDPDYAFNFTETALTEIGNYATIFAVVAEELAHASNHVTETEFFDALDSQSENENDFSYKKSDVMLWSLSDEAKAKLITAVMIIEQAIAGEIYDQAYFLSESEGGVQNMVSLIMPIFLEYGEKHVRENPGLLLPAFLSFFEDQFEMDAYYDHYAPMVEEEDGEDAIEFNDYENVFGVIPGFSGNMFHDGLPEYIVAPTSMRALARTVNRDSIMNDWLRAENALRAPIEEIRERLRNRRNFRTNRLRPSAPNDLVPNPES